ncbi:MAG: hypothetical protein ACFCD0_15240 [Gemmataceae bacterium]
MRRAHFLSTLVIGAALTGLSCQRTATKATTDIGSKPKMLRHFGRGDRYGEVVLVRRNGLKFEAEVWGTQGLNDCPEESWKALDAKAIRAETGALGVVLNGPRYCLPNSTRESFASTKRRKFGQLEMRHLATLEVRPGLGPPIYKERVVRRKTIVVFKKGEEIYELKSPEGTVYVMRSMSQIVDPKLKLAQLPTLGSRLKLPTGWSYQARTLDADLVLATKGKAVVLQDDLRNAYQRR